MDPDWWRKACADPVWHELNEKCPVFKWSIEGRIEYGNTYWSRGCTGSRPSQHYEVKVLSDPTMNECDGTYQCADRSDEAMCESLPGANIYFARGFHCL